MKMLYPRSDIRLRRSFLATAIFASCSTQVQALGLFVDKYPTGEGVVVEADDNWCSLIEAIKTMENSLYDPPTNNDCQWQLSGGTEDFISLPSNVTFTLTDAYDLYNDGPAGLPQIRNTTFIYGNGSTITRSGSIFTGGFRLFDVDEPGTLKLQNITLSNGLATDATDPGSGSTIPDAVNGGGVIVRGTLELVNATVSGNSAVSDGGGVHVVGGSLTLNNATVSSNSANSGGGISVDKGALSITNGSHVDSNNSYNGGGGVFVFGSGASLTISHSNIISNTASNSAGSGAGVLIQSSATGSITDSEIASNVGGGIRVYDHASLSLTKSRVEGGIGDGVVVEEYASATILESTIRNYTSSTTTLTGGAPVIKYGRGVFVHKKSHATISRSTISGNASAEVGGGLTANNSTVTLVNSTVSGNSAREAAGVIAEFDALITLTNATVTGNSSSGSPSSSSTVYANGVMAFEATLTLKNTIVAGNADRDCSQVNASTFSGSNPADKNWFGDSTCGRLGDGDPKLGPLVSNGGLTLTHALLKDAGPIDAGDDAVCNASPVDKIDQRGKPRTTVCDIGAYEFQHPDTGNFFVVPLPGGKTVIFGL